jgi:allantoate deiminase
LDPVKNEFTHLAEEVIDRCKKLASLSEDAGSTRRTFLSPPMREVHRQLSEWLEPAGVRIQIDAVGNFRALYSASEADLPRLIVGSHLDTVPNAGAYDGPLGVLIAVALLQALHGRRPPYAIEVVGFSEEEGVRFGVPFIGSRALVGRVDDALLNTNDAQGISVREAIEQFGLNPREIPQARTANDVCGYLEFHIEQGPVLENLNLPLAVVEAIAGQNRMEFTFVGRANHAGTTPMNLRYDAMAAAAEWITAVERIAKETAGPVATVGSVQTIPGVVNVIAGEARLSLDVRHQDDNMRTKAVEQIIRSAQEIARLRGLSVRWSEGMNQPAVAMNPFLSSQIEQAIGKAECRPHRMVSGAGHDAMIMAEQIPSAMIFLRTPGGISHDPAESVAVDDVAKAIEVGLCLLDQLALTPTFYKRTCRA